MSIYGDVTDRILDIINDWDAKLLALPFDVLCERRNNQGRTIKQILGHLVDSAVNNHHRIVRLQYNEKLDFPDYRQDNDTWIAIQNYQDEDWEQLVSFWKIYNRHMIHIIVNVNESCLEHTWYDFEGNKETLRTIIEGYLWHLNLHLKEIQTLIDA